jgi:hypothetical protein
MRHHFVIILLLVVFPVASRAEQHRVSAPELRASLVGTWEVFELPPARHMEEPLAFDPTGQLGKKIVFTGDSFEYDKDFMFFPERCPRARYSVHRIPIPYGAIPSKGSLNFDVPPDTPAGLGPLRPDEEIEVRLDCAGEEMTALDFSSGGFLAIYWTTGFFYLKKTSQ